MTTAESLPRSWRFVRRRSMALEAMDRPDLDPRLRNESLAGLGRLRRSFLRPEPLLGALLRRLPPGDGRTSRLVELGAGTGELSAWIGRALRHRGLRVEMVATDRVGAPGVREFDCTASGGWMDADLHFSNLLLHHLTEDEIRRSLGRQVAHSRLGAVHLDIVRGPLLYYLTRLSLPLLGYPRINQSDALLSIQAAFTAPEMESLGSGFQGRAVVRRVLPFRQILSIPSENPRSAGR
ncbi:MAG TPA: hypothetical protein VN931_09565 [Fibrobacteria bacterium]|nr:hypothetical protein [Fibrobacteria bacterium]